MTEHVYQKGNEIIEMGEKCKSLTFVVNGIIELSIID